MNISLGLDNAQHSYESTTTDQHFLSIMFITSTS